MAIEGALQDVSLADICQLLAMGMKTGCLSITDRSNFGYIYFEKGRVIYASVLNRRDRLGELLVRNHVITRKDLSTATGKQAEEKGKKLGEILVEIEALTEDELHKYIQMQIEEAVYHLFAWTQGSFHFDTDQIAGRRGLLPREHPSRGAAHGGRSSRRRVEPGRKEDPVVRYRLPARQASR